MLGRSGYSRAMSANVGEIERRLRSVEQRLERVGGRAFASAIQTTDHVGETRAGCGRTSEHNGFTVPIQ